jgi:ABC-type Mn2+/Zn2+ transport system ATPase subunit
MNRPTRFEIKGLFGNRNVQLPIEMNALILVGPNGVGKSTVTNIFYFFLTRQWRRLAEYDFSEVAVWFGDEEIRAARSDITGLPQLDRVTADFPPSSRLSLHLDRLRSSGLLEEFVSSRRMGPQARVKFAETLGIAEDEVRHLQMSIFRRISAYEDDDIFSTPRLNVEKQLSSLLSGRTLYLPTYRRIEKDLKDIIPSFDDVLRASTKSWASITTGRSAKHYVDLVNFGMEDVRSNVDRKNRYLRDYSLAQFNELSALYLRDVIKGRADQYSPSQISGLEKGAIDVILGRVSEEVLSAEEKDLLKEKILSMKGKKRADMEVNDRYLAHYFSRLMSASADISAQEEDIISYISVCNAYLDPGKKMVYDDTKFTVEIIDDRGRPIDLSVLSSGEKQVVSLFSHLYLDEAQSQIVIIDEPELSLSVPWQKRFLTDILDSGHCNFILAVTHSPFIYQNRLKNTAVDLRRRTTVVDEVA